MNKILRPFIGKCVVVYLDDVTVYSKSFEEHIQHLEQIFKVIQDANLSLNIEKCHFCLRQLTFLGHIIGQNGISPDNSKLEVV